MHVRPATPADHPAIVAIHCDGRRAAYPGILPPEVLDAVDFDRWSAGRTEWVSQQGPEFRSWVAEANGTVVGFCDTGPTKDAGATDGTAEVHLLYADPGHIGAGIGHALFAHAVADLQTRSFAPLILWTLQQNHRAQQFYERHGWRADGTSRPYTPFGWHEAVSTEVRYTLA